MPKGTQGEADDGLLQKDKFIRKVRLQIGIRGFRVKPETHQSNLKNNCKAYIRLVCRDELCSSETLKNCDCFTCLKFADERSSSLQLTNSYVIAQIRLT